MNTALKINVLSFFFATVIVIVALALYSIRWILLVTLIGIALSVLFTPGIKKLNQKLKIPQVVSAFLFFGLSIAILGGTLFLLYILVSEQLDSLIKKLPDLIEIVRSRFLKILNNYPTLKKFTQLFRFEDTVKSISTQILQGLKIGISAMGGFIYVLVIGLYLAINPEYYFRSFLSLCPMSHRENVKDLLQRSATSFRKWFISQLIAMTAVGTATGVGLLILGIDNWLLFGVLTALLDIVPYIGPVIAAFCVLIVTFASIPEKTLWVLILFILMQQVEGHLIIPLSDERRWNFLQLHLIITMLILAHWFGIFGVLIAPGLLVWSI